MTEERSQVKREWGWGWGQESGGKGEEGNGVIKGGGGGDKVRVEPTIVGRGSRWY
jgi:hypothetical protein